MELYISHISDIGNLFENIRGDSAFATIVHSINT